MPLEKVEQTLAVRALCLTIHILRLMKMINLGAPGNGRDIADGKHWQGTYLSQIINIDIGTD